VPPPAPTPRPARVPQLDAAGEAALAFLVARKLFVDLERHAADAWGAVVLKPDGRQLELVGATPEEALARSRAEVEAWAVAKGGRR
jgi:hypothetical protein